MVNLKMRKTNLLLIVFVLMMISLNTVYANFKVDVEPVVDEIYPGGVAIYDVFVTNTGTGNEELKYVFSEDPSWSIITTPLYHQTSFTVKPNQRVQTKIQVKPDESIDGGQKYTYTISIESKTNQNSKAVGLNLFLKSTNKLTDYVPLVEVDVDLDSEIDPRQNAILKITLTNHNPLNLSDLQLSVQSKVNSNNNQLIDIPLSGNEKKTYELILEYDDLETPKKDDIVVSAKSEKKNVTFGPKKKSIQIKSYSEIKQTNEITKMFLKTQNDIVFYNDGNVENQKVYREQTSLFKNIFTKSEPAATDVILNGYRYQEWAIDIDMQGSEKITVIVNYRPLFIIFVLLIVAIILYYIFRSPILVKKQAKQVIKGEEESSKVKVLIHIKNRTGKTIESVNVIDKVPQFAMIDKDFPVGTMQPDKIIKHDKKGTLVKWTIPTLEAYEERIVTYFISSKLKIIGGMKLPPTTVKYKNKMNNLSKVISNKVNSE